MKILVTGANGLLGSKLIEWLSDQPGITTIATARKDLTNVPPGVSFSLLDITDAAQVEQAVQSHRPDVIIHTAAMTNVDQCETERESCWNTNVTAVESLVAACAKYHVHFVHVSTDFIFDGSHGPLDETAIPHPVNYYGESKLAAEQCIQRSTLSWAIVRTVLVYGVSKDMSRSNIVLWVKKNLEAGKPIKVVTDQWRTPTLAEDLARGCYLAAIKRAQGIYHVSGEEMMTPFDMAVQTAAHFGLDASLISPATSATFQQPAKRPPRTGFIIEKAKRDLGYLPHSFSEGLALIASQLKG